MVATDGRIRLHIENIRTQNRVFHLDQARVDAALARHPEIAARLDITVGYDQEIYREAIADAVGFVGWRFPHEHIREQAPKLKWIHLTGAGLEHLLPLDWLPEGTALTNNRGVHAQKAGEFAMMAMLMMNSAVPALFTAQREHRWQGIFTPRIAGKTVLVIGVGNMGGAAAQAAKQLGMTVLGIRRSAEPHPAVDEMYGIDALPTLLPRADIVLVTTPLTERTRHLLGRAELDLLRPEAGLINMGRAEVVDYAVLAEKLREGEIAGAILDVFKPEPLPADSPLWDTPRLIVTPHCSSDDLDDYAAGTLDLVFENAARLLDGRPLKNRVRPELGY